MLTCKEGTLARMHVRCYEVPSVSAKVFGPKVTTIGCIAWVTMSVPECCMNGDRGTCE